MADASSLPLCLAARELRLQPFLFDPNTEGWKVERAHRQRKDDAPMHAEEVAAWSANCQKIMVDLGAGDERFVRAWATKHPRCGAIAVDLSKANLRKSSHMGDDHALFVVADALAPPAELSGVATHVAIDFPWGSLLHGLLDVHPGLPSGVEGTGSRATPLDIMLNAGALAEAGWTMESGGERVAAIPREAGINVAATRVLSPTGLRRSPPMRDKQLAFRRDPRAVWFDATQAPVNAVSSRTAA